MSAPEPREYLSPQQVAELLGGEKPLTLSTLARWRSLGVGPSWFRCGLHRVRYRRADVEAWAEAQRHAPVARGPRAKP